MGAEAMYAEMVTSMSALAVEEKVATVGKTEMPLICDIRRYYCKFCGLCRSKKALIRSHMLSHHQEEKDDEKIGGVEEASDKGRNMCEECGVSFRKPAYLKQHMQSHSLQVLLFVFLGWDRVSLQSGLRIEACSLIGVFSWLVDDDSLKQLWVYGVKHWIPCRELQNAEATEWTSIRRGTSCEAPSG